MHVSVLEILQSQSEVSQHGTFATTGFNYLSFPMLTACSPNVYYEGLQV